MSAGQLSDQFNVSKPTMSAHFAVLKEADLVHAEDPQGDATMNRDLVGSFAWGLGIVALALSGLVYAGLWVFAPIDVAVAVGCGAVATGIAVTLAYSLMLRQKAKAA